MNCTCSHPVPFPKRSARSGIVLHESSTGSPVILIQSPAPKQWEIMGGTDTAWRKGKVNSDNFEDYHLGVGSPNWQLAEPVKAEFDAKISDPIKARNTFVYAENQWSLSTFAAATTAVPTPPFAPIGAAAPTPPVPPAPKATTGYTPRAKKVSVSAGEFEIDAPNPDRYWYESEADARMFSDFTKIKLAGYDTNCIIVGPSGFGKTESIKRLAERLSEEIGQTIPAHVVNCQVITTPEKWLGEKGADPTRGTYFDVAEHLRWVERVHPDCEGAPFCIILYDELSRLRSEFGNMLFSLLDGQHGMEVPQMGRRVIMDPKNIVFATANIGSAYAGTFAIDWALRERFDATMERKMPPFDEEVKVLTTAYPKVTKEQAESILKVAEHTRTLWKNGEMEAPISTRLALAWARWVAGGYSVKDAAEYTVIPRYSEDGGIESDRAKLKQAIDGKVSA